MFPLAEPEADISDYAHHLRPRTSDTHGITSFRSLNAKMQLGSPAMHHAPRCASGIGTRLEATAGVRAQVSGNPPIRQVKAVGSAPSEMAGFSHITEWIMDEEVIPCELRIGGMIYALDDILIATDPDTGKQIASGTISFWKGQIVEQTYDDD